MYKLFDIIFLVMKMKKTLILMSFAIILGSLCGKFLFKKYQDTTLAFNESMKLYFLQEGVYQTKESVNNNKFLYYIIILFIYYLSSNIFGEHYSYTKYIFDIFPVVSYSFLGIIVIYILINRKTNNQ